MRIGDFIKRNKDGQLMKIVPDGEATLYVDNDKIEIMDARFYVENGAATLIKEGE